MIIVFGFSKEDRELLTRFLNYVEGAQQKEVDALTERMRATQKRLADAIVQIIGKE